FGGRGTETLHDGGLLIGGCGDRHPVQGGGLDLRVTTVGLPGRRSPKGWPVEARGAEESVDGGSDDDDADHLDIRDRVDAEFELLLVPALRQRRRMAGDAV